MYKKRLLLLFIFIINITISYAQTDSAQITDPTISYSQPTFQNSAYFANRAAKRDSVKRAQDSLKAVGDSLSMVWLKPPDPKRPNKFIDSLIDRYEVKDLNFGAWAAKLTKKVERYDIGTPRTKGELWVVGSVFILLFFFALLKNAFSKELAAIMQAFFSNRVLGQINKEEKFFNSWPFVFLYLLFGFTIGMFLYQCGKYFQLSYNYTGFVWFLRLSAVVILLFTAKIIISSILGFLLDLKKIAKEYIAYLILSYFNAALIFFPIVIAFCLTPFRFAPIYIYISLVILAGIFIFQFLRAATNVLSGYRLPKVYLIVYLCALEISPILILIKALRF